MSQKNVVSYKKCCELFASVVAGVTWCVVDGWVWCGRWVWRVGVVVGVGGFV